MQLLSPAEIAEVMTIPPEARHYAWVRLLADSRVTVDMIRDAEGLGPQYGATVIDDYPGAFGGDWGSAGFVADPTDYNLDLNDGVKFWAYRFGQATAWVLLGIGAVTLIRFAGRLFGRRENE